MHSAKYWGQNNSKEQKDISIYREEKNSQRNFSHLVTFSLSCWNWIPDMYLCTNYYIPDWQASGKWSTNTTLRKFDYNLLDRCLLCQEKHKCSPYTNLICINATTCTWVLTHPPFHSLCMCTVSVLRLEVWTCSFYIVWPTSQMLLACTYHLPRMKPELDN